MRVLVVESDSGAGLSLKQDLSRRCFAVDWTQCGEKGYYLARTNPYDAIVLGRIESGPAGREICRSLRELGRGVPIIMLTATDDAAARIEALASGADDCLAPPVHFEELFLRIRTILRRAADAGTDVLEFEDLTLDIQKQEVRRGGKRIYLTRKEFQLMELFLRRGDRVISRGEILEHVWDSEADPFSNTIETHIWNLRQKIDRGRRRKLISTVPGRGYRLAFWAAFTYFAAALWLGSACLPDAASCADFIFS